MTKVDSSSPFWTGAAVLSVRLGKQIGDCVIWRLFANWRGLDVKQAILYHPNSAKTLRKKITFSGSGFCSVPNVTEIYATRNVTSKA